MDYTNALNDLRATINVEIFSRGTSELLSAAKARVDHQIEVFKSYGPAQALTLENAVVGRTGNYVVVVVCSDGEGAKKITDQYL